MLRGLKSRYAEHHGVHITDEASAQPSPFDAT
jgi:ATP-dependent Clp protease ATP-binding subunit ClpA